MLRLLIPAFLPAVLLAVAMPAAAQDAASSADQAPVGSAAQQAPIAVADPGELAFEQGRWEDAIKEYRNILASYPEDRLSLLRIAQAQRELGRYELALKTLDDARTANAPEAMVDFERARNLALLGRMDDALTALDASDHNGLRALELVEQAKEFDSVRSQSRFQRLYKDVRARVYPCEGMPEASQFDFWLGTWEVRASDGTLIGTNHVTKTDGGCSIQEHWQGAGGSTGSSMSYYSPSEGKWRQIWTGSGGTTFDIAGTLVDGVMKMEGTIEYVEPNRIVAFRGSWTRADDGRVRQRLEEFDLGAQTWDVWFDGFYRRIN